MSVFLSDKEIETFKNHGFSEDQIQDTVNQYRDEGIDDNAIRSKIDVKLNEFANPPVLQGQVTYNDILDNENLTPQQKADYISGRGETYRKNLDNEFKKEITPKLVGGITKIVSPAAGLVPVVGLPLAGAIYGIGQGIEDGDNIKGILGKSGLYSGASFLGGQLGGKLGGHIVSKNPLFANFAKRAVSGATVGGFDGLAEGIKENINQKKYSPDILTRYTLGGVTSGMLLNSLGTIPFKQPAVPHSEIEAFRQLIRDGVVARRGLIDSQVYQSVNDINNYIAQIKELGNKLNISDKLLREISPFLREQTLLPKRLNRPDLTEVWQKLSAQDKGVLSRLASETSDKMEKYWDNYMKARGIDKKNNPETYITHLWDLTPQQLEKLQNYFKTYSQSEKSRHIQSYAQGIDGITLPTGEVMYLKPKTLDYAEILRNHAFDVINATENKNFSNWLKKLKLSDGSPIIGSAQKGYLEINHPALPKDSFVHKQFKDVLNPVYEDVSKKSKIAKAYDTVNNFAKTCKFLGNGMHGIALTESAAAHEGIIPFKTFKTLTNLPKIIDGIKNNNYEFFNKSSLAKKAIKDGVQFGNISDIDLGEFTTGLDNILKVVDTLTLKTAKPITETIRKTVNVNNKVLWDYLHNTYKLHAYDTLINRVQKQYKKPLTSAIRKEIAQVVNDTFGGQNWDTLGIKPSAVQNARRLLLSPDWNMSAFIRHGLGVFSTEIGQKVLNYFAKNSEMGSAIREFSRKVGLSAFTNDVKAAGVRGELLRQYFFRFIVQTAIYTNLINATCRFYDMKKNPELYKDSEQGLSVYDNNRFIEDDTTLTKITDTLFPRPFVGRDDGGREKYARVSKQARELPEFVEDGVTGAIQKTASKSAPLINPLATKLADEFTGGWNDESIKERYQKTFTPFTLSKEDFSPIDSLYSTTKGVNYYQAVDFVENALRNDDLDAINEFLPKVQMNKIDSENVLKNSIRTLMTESLQNNDDRQLEKFWDYAEELNIDAEKVYKSAIYKYLETKNKKD